MTPRMIFWPRNLIRDSANAAIELTTRPSATVQTVMITELSRNWANGTRSNTPR